MFVHWTALVAIFGAGKLPNVSQGKSEFQGKIEWKIERASSYTSIVLLGATSRFHSSNHPVCVCVYMSPTFSFRDSGVCVFVYKM